MQRGNQTKQRRRENDERDDMPIVRSHVPAGAAAAPVSTTAANSVFALGKPDGAKRVARTALDPLAVEIHVGIPIPDKRTGVGSHVYSQLWARIQVGGMVKLPDRQANSLVAYVKKAKLSCAVRRLEPGIKGVWRTA